MGTKIFHIINVGTNILTNYQREKKIYDFPSPSDNAFWEKKLNDSNFLNEIYSFIKLDPHKNSAELNSFLRLYEKNKDKEHYIYLIGTNTPSNHICVNLIKRFFEDTGHRLTTPKEVEVYFHESEKQKEFIEDISKLIDQLISVARKKKAEGYEVVFNPTGGMKAHVIACALAGFLTDSKVYYIYEDFKDIVELPPVFHIPNQKERELLEKLKNQKPISGYDYYKLEEEYADEIIKLEIYDLVRTETDENGKKFRIKITSKGLLILNEIKK